MHSYRTVTISLLLIASTHLLHQLHAGEAIKKSRPNILYLLCDDLGVGDLRSYNEQSKISTPNLDQFAAQGLRFTDAHSGSAVCTPTRYGIMCGRYAWRTKLQSGVLGGLSPSLIAADQPTVAQFLKSQGYRTACIGKWHLGLDWVKQPGKEVTELNIENESQNRNVRYDLPFQGGPLAAGFDEYFGISASLDMVPYTFLRNDRIESDPSIENNFGMRSIDDPRKTRRGPAAADFQAIDVLPRITQEAIAFLHRQAKQSTVEPEAAQPFFLYLPFASPHTPVAPSQDWIGKSNLNPYADFVMQQDACVGEILKALDASGLADNTIVFFTSDNGCSPEADIPFLKSKDHDPCVPFRGHKADIFEGGHRVPMIVRWPGTIAPGTSNPQTVCLTDLFATVADVLGEPLPSHAAPDSSSLLRAFRGDAATPLRTSTVHHSINGSFAIRKGPHKLIFCGDSGGWSQPLQNAKKSTESSRLQLYDLSADVGETKNLVDERPEVVRELTLAMEETIARGRSTSGIPLKNDVEVKLWKYVNRPAIEQRKPTALENLDQLHLWEPAWRSKTVYAESCVLLTNDQGETSSRLAFPAAEIVEIRSADQAHVYQLNQDYRLLEDRQTLVWLRKVDIEAISWNEMYPPKDSPNSYKHRVGNPEQNLLYAPGRWFHDHNIEVTYKRADEVATKAPVSKLDRTMKKLTSKSPLRIAVSGDSISTGLDASSLTDAFPKQPGYPELIKVQLEATYGGDVLVTNRAVAGWSVANGLQDLETLMASNPDLLIVAYGMNDVGRRDPDWYEGQTRAIIEKAQAISPEIEILLVSTMVGNKEWIHTPREMFTEYRDRLNKLTANSVQCVDVTEVWLTLLKHKHDLDLTGNGLNHPNDFGHRLYAQAILEFFNK